jgi:NTP pyrophosphatase (non-canonical NTP hydrolase)
MKLRDKITVQERIELLAITAEECGELTQECMKIVRFGKDTDAMQNLTKEAGDVMCMIQLLEEKGFVKYEDIEARVKEKREKLKTFSSLTNL